jgi:Tachylectin/Trypsin
MGRQRQMARWIFGAACLATWQLAGAGEEHLGRSQSPLVSVTVVTAAEQEQLGLLSLASNLGGCTASLLTNDWAVTAAHCLNATDMRRPAGVTLSAAWTTAQSRTANYIYRFWGIDAAGSTYDIALLHLGAPFTVNGSTTGYVREMSELSLQDMDTQNIAVYGSGINVLARNTPTGPMPVSSDGIMRSAVFTVNRIERTLFWYPKGNGGETVGSGDSGGPSFEMTRGAPRIAGVHALCHASCLAGQQCPAGNPWQWVSDISECGDAPVGYLGGAIGDLLHQAWDPARPVQTLQVMHSEGGVQKEMLLGQIDTLPWDYVRRAAQRMCLNRGFVSGFLDGTGKPGSRYGLHCVSAAAGFWRDALAPDMARINDRYRDVAQIGWAQGARAANDLCKNMDASTVGGILTGFQAVSNPSGGFYDQKDGVFCFNAGNAHWFDSTRAELAAQGTPLGDLNATGWAVAARAAMEYCRRKFYSAGGFFNGHQLGDKHGIVCIGANSLVTDRVSATDSVRSYRDAGGGSKPTGIGAMSRAAGTPRVAGTGGAAPPPNAPGQSTFYALEKGGALAEYRHDALESGGQPRRLGASGAGWRAYLQAIPGGSNHVYAIEPSGDLVWFQHDGVQDGADSWRGPVRVGSGWRSFRQVLGGGDGVLYAIGADGTLTWYRHLGVATGDPRAWVGPKKIGTGWHGFKQVISAGGGALYAITQDGRLMLYRHLDPANGEMRWSGPTQVGTGWQGFSQVFSTGNGVLYGLAPDGKLSYYRHLTWNAAQPTFQWVGPLPAGELDPAALVVPLLP